MVSVEPAGRPSPAVPLVHEEGRLCEEQKTVFFFFSLRKRMCGAGKRKVILGEESTKYGRERKAIKKLIKILNKKM